MKTIEDGSRGVAAMLIAILRESAPLPQLIVSNRTAGLKAANKTQTAMTSTTTSTITPKTRTIVKANVVGWMG